MNPTLSRLLKGRPAHERVRWLNRSTRQFERPKQMNRLLLVFMVGSLATACASSGQARIAYNTSERVGGIPMELYIIEKDGAFETGASWSAGKPMHMSGNAPTAAAADVHMDIYRSVRIVQP